jgi:hypothetical protein
MSIESIEHGYEPEYKKMPMWDQLGKILDSEGNPVERDWVVCDDGVRVEGITIRDADDIKTLILAIEKPATRNEFLHKIQMSEGLNEVLQYVKKS